MPGFLAKERCQPPRHLEAVLDEAHKRQSVPIRCLTGVRDQLTLADQRHRPRRDLAAERIQEGLELAERERPDLILMDLAMPVLDGWEVTRRLKANDDLKSIPIIALTARAMVGDEEKARDAGCDDYLAKPLDENELFTKVARWLE